MLSSGLQSIVPTAYAASDPTVVAAFGSAIDPIITNILLPLVQLAFAVAVIVFAYGLFQMVFHGDDPDVRKRGRLTILGGVIGLAIMSSAWGIIYWVSNTVGQFK